MTWGTLLWLGLLVVAAGFVTRSLCAISARADAEAERMNAEWRAREKR